ncbi:hypothetical protein [Vibrio phage vB_VpS_PG28]|nr:hypothetical protein [Vibrio phage vB_VpS_PG28]
MSSNVVQSLVVDFSNGDTVAISDTSYLRVESDTRELKDGGKNTRSTPLFTDTHYLLVYSNNVGSIEAQVSSGTAVLTSATESRTITEYLTFDNTKQKMLDYPASLIHSMKWQGSGLGALTVTDNLLITAEKSGVAVLEVVYETSFRILQLTAPTDIPEGTDTWNIALIVSGEELIKEA